MHDELGLNERATATAPIWADALALFENAPHVVDVRSAGILGAIELAPRVGAAGARGSEVAQACYEAGLLVRSAGDTMVLSLPLVIAEAQISEMMGTLRAALERTS